MLFHGGTPDHRAGSENQSDIADAERAVRCGFWLVESKKAFTVGENSGGGAVFHFRDVRKIPDAKICHPIGRRKLRKYFYQVKK